MKTYFTIIIPSFNRAHHLSNTIKSVISQSHTNWELILVDDGSTDNTRELVASFSDPRIKYIYQDNAERSAARNKGIQNASGAWICFLDSDDEYTGEHLCQLNAFISNHNPSPGLICTGLIVQSEKEKIEKPFLDLAKNNLSEISEKFLIPTQVCVHRSILEKELFKPRFRLWEDTHLWLRIAAQYPVYQIEEYTAIQHIHDEGTVVQGMKAVRASELNQYIAAINDLQTNYRNLFKDKLPNDFFSNYKASKYHMYLYQARQNKQLSISLQIWWRAMTHRPSVYLLSELPKIFVNQIGVGIHGK